MCHAPSERLAVEAMGTRFELVIAGAPSPAQHWRSIGEEALALITEWHDRLSLFDSGSLVSHINCGAAASPVRIDREMMELLVECRRLNEQTGGAFDPTIGTLMRRHGLRAPGGRSDGAWGFANVVLDTDASTVRFSPGEVEIDFGAVAKGYVLDLCAEALREMGVTAALLHAGTSSVIAIGSPPGGRAWVVAIGAEPGSPRVALRDRALSVSAGRPSAESGTRTSHTVDPRTGALVECLSATCVVGTSATECEAWSTALLVLTRRPRTMPHRLTSVLPDPRGTDWHVEGDDAWRVELTRKGVA